MKRPGSVIAIAVVELTGSTLTLGLAALVFLGALVRSAADTAAAAQLHRSVLGGVVFLAFGAWGLATGIEMLRMRIWALVSTLLYALLLLGTGMVLLCIGGVLISTAGALPQAAAAGGIFLVPSALIMLGIAVWWLAATLRPGTRAAFRAWRAPGRQLRPLSISSTGFLLIAGGLIALAEAALETHPQLTLGGHMLQGTGARLATAVLGAVCAVVGYFLLRLRPWARWATLVLLALAIANGAVTAVVGPQALQQRMLLMQAQLPTAAREIAARAAFLAYISMLGYSMALELVLMYFIWTRGEAFARRTASEPAPASEAPPLELAMAPIEAAATETTPDEMPPPPAE